MELQNPNKISAVAIRSHLPENLKEIPIEVFQTIDSTNNRAREEALRGAVSGTLILSEEQTTGRGRVGRQFYSPGGTTARTRHCFPAR